MASSGGKDSSSPNVPDGRLGGSIEREEREHSNPEVISVLYEELFENENNERPCYLPDSGQEDSTSVSQDYSGDTEEDGNNRREIFSKAKEDSLVEEKGELKPLNGTSPKGAASQMNYDSRECGSAIGTLEEDLDARSTTGNQGEIHEKDQEFNFTDRVGAESSSTERSVLLDGELSSDRGLDGPPSPASSQGGTSGYMAGSGSCSASTSSVSGIEAGTDQDTEGIGSRKEEHGVWVPGKRHNQEDDTHSSWRRHKKHFFILSNAGKPIYSRYGDEHKLAGFSATLQAIMSFVENSGDTIHLVRAGDHQIIYLVRGPLYLVCISSTDEPFQILKGQLELLHGQLLLILTKAVEKCFSKNSKFDMRPLLGGTDVVFSSLIHAFSWDPASFLNAYSCLPLPYAARQAACGALQDMTESGALFALLMCGSKYLNKDTCLILLTGDSNDFFHLKECRAQIEIVLRESDVLREVNNSIVRGGLRIEDLPEGPVPAEVGSSREDRSSDDAARTSALNVVPGAGGAAGLWHFIYRSTYLDQFVASEFSPPLNTRSAQKRLYRAYQKLHASMHDTGSSGPHKMQYRRDENHVLLSWRTSDFELYAAFDPLAEKSSAIFVCNRICQWIRDVESEIFLLGATPFNW